MLLGSKYTENNNNLYYMTIDTYSIAKSNDITVKPGQAFPSLTN